MEDIETITMSAKGQVIIPARIRKKFRLKKGDKLLLEVDNRNIKMIPKTIDITTLVGSVKGLDMKLVRKQIEEMRKDDEDRERLIEEAIKIKKR